jgi:hypothetical protein
MDIIVTNVCFTGELTIPQLTEATVSQNLAAAIAKREPEFLEELLGYPLYKLFKAWDGAEAGRFKDLRDGVEYTNRFGEIAKWKGFKRADNSTPIANYVYYWWLRKDATLTTGGGEKKSDKKGASNIGSENKQARAWNEMVKWNQEFWEFMYTKQDVYPEFLTTGIMARRKTDLYTVQNPYSL